ncbi:DUF1236 domain-containing protein [Hansschlegelia zhihuaiae]|uniref:DUF1236 domain-containing protein n=1 Tax=Hansschlegelia zhihuaiae TaxID=405005 RepID=A0A4Q0M8L6_9HYPH|nr:DUF1236 domain-containing protein [Hansschlegelia zhihuaiae]RXF69263.1 DUF1236 domain-containing protein [Hansschlegelia zhihuaiae]
MRTALIMLVGFGAVTGATSVVAQDVIVREPAERRVIVREPSERRVIIEEDRDVVVRRPSAVVRRYVVEERRPSIAYERRVVVGDTLPESVETYDVPDSDYGYTVLNDRRYILDHDRRIVDVVD